jgi:hypothetical protein
VKGTLALSWGPWGGFYLHRSRICLGWVAITWFAIELDDLMEAYADAPLPLGPEDAHDQRLMVARAMFAPLDSPGFHPSGSQVDEAARVIDLIERSDGRHFAETEVVTVPAGPVATVVSAALGELAMPEGKYVITVDWPHE